MEALARAEASIDGNHYILNEKRMDTFAAAVDAAEFLGERFRGRWVLDASREFSCPQAELSVSEIMEKLEQLRGEGDGATHLELSTQSLWWITPYQMQAHETLLLADREGGETQGLEVTLRTERSGAATVIRLCLVLSAQAISDDPMPQGYAQALKKRHEAIAGNRLLTDQWFAQATKLVLLAIKRLMNCKGTAPRYGDARPPREA